MKTRTRHYFPLFIIVSCCVVTISCTSNTTKNQNEKSDSTMSDQFRNNLKEAKNLAKELKRKGISDERVLAAIGKVPRHLFVGEYLREYAYIDEPLSIEKGQTISQPYTVAFQTELLKLQPGEKVLEIGTGSGYQAAILCEMNVEVYSIERYYELHILAKKRLNKLGYYPKLFFGDGFEGLPEYAPFDKILVTAAPEEIPEKLLLQLRVGGWMVVPLGGRQIQKMTVIKRINEDKFNLSEYGDFIFVPMQTGTEE